MNTVTLRGIVYAALASLTLGSTTAQADTAEEVIAVTRAQWAAQAAKKPMAEQTVMLADDYTEFSPDFPTRIDGKGMNTRLYEAFEKDSGTFISGDMANEKVQVYGDTAILTYNFIGAAQDADGAVTPILAKSTRVYVKQRGKWMLVHANFAPVTAPE